MTQKLDYIQGDYVVYPTHGVGQITGIETKKVAGMEVQLYVITFEKDKMTLKLPVANIKNSGLRKLSTRNRIDDAISTLKAKTKVKKAMWSKRAPEYEAKINSGDPVQIAQVVRDLHAKSVEQQEQSYSERQMYLSALQRLARELAVIENIDENNATLKLESVLKLVA